MPRRRAEQRGHDPARPSPRCRPCSGRARPARDPHGRVAVDAHRGHVARRAGAAAAVAPARVDERGDHRMVASARRASPRRARPARRRARRGAARRRRRAARRRRRSHPRRARSRRGHGRPAARRAAGTGWRTSTSGRAGAAGAGTSGRTSRSRWSEAKRTVSMTVRTAAASGTIYPLDRELIFVTGKGGVGKTTVAARARPCSPRAPGGARSSARSPGQTRATRLLHGPAAGRRAPRSRCADGPVGDDRSIRTRALAEWATSVVGSRRVVHALTRVERLRRFVAAAPGARSSSRSRRRGSSGAAERWTRAARATTSSSSTRPASGHGLGLLRDARARSPTSPASGRSRRRRAACAELLEDPARSGDRRRRAAGGDAGDRDARARGARLRRRSAAISSRRAQRACGRGGSRAPRSPASTRPATACRPARGRRCAAATASWASSSASFGACGARRPRRS